MKRLLDLAVGRRAYRSFLMAAALPLVILFSACYPKYKFYESDQRDYKVNVPYEWLVMTDEEGDRYTNATFIGPFEPEFYLGTPTLSIRWHKHFYPHNLPKKAGEKNTYSAEIYSGVEDYIETMIREVYGKKTVLHSGAPNPKLIGRVSDMGTVKVAGRSARHVIITSPANVGDQNKWGTSLNPETKERQIWRKHAYVLLPLEKGFYVFVYPATREGYDRYEKQFFSMVNSFVLLTEGPGGAGPKK